jgi:hypothetical protein
LSIIFEFNKEVIFLLYEATHSHPAAKCPLLSAEGKAMLKQLFSEQNVKNSGINLTAAYMSCPQDTGVDHKGFFTIDAQNPEAITKFFGPMAVDVRPVKPLSEVAKTL